MTQPAKDAPGVPPLSVSLFDLGPFAAPPEHMNLAAHALGHDAPDDKICLTVVGDDGTRRWTYGEMRDAVLRAAAGLQVAGVMPGDRVILRIGNEPRFPILFFGAVAAGAVAVPTSTLLTGPELARLVEDADPALVLCADDERPAGFDAPGRLAGDARIAEIMGESPAPDFGPTHAEDPAFLIYTSGTSGRPKGVLHAQRSAWARRMMWDGWYGLTADDAVLHAGAFNWTYTLGAGLQDPWGAGASTTIYTGHRDPGIWPRLVAESGATIFAGAPGVYRQMLKSGADLGPLKQLRHGITAGERTPQPLREAWEAATGKPLFEALGMSEISTYISCSPSVPVRPGFAGRPQKGRRIALLGDDGAPVPVGEMGRIAVDARDPGLMLGYWRQDTEYEGDWFVTGDVAVMDEDGYVRHEGRADEVMNALGYRVSPGEVEAALAQAPGVAEVAVAALPVRADLEIIAAFVVPKEGAEIHPAAILAHAEEALAKYKRPREVITVDALPRTPNGKVQRKALVEAHRKDRG
ncbi:acyl-CoA synthetase [Rhodovulum sp. DZ06]|uniref:acyl-CoA synthetase n=1 Tax=Rhodovulum sp. DZ06 TaxID=3425126 RepID=UPI003D354018